ncbi:armadillo-type protein [Xylariaceae sp. FL0804]|nr:armadillo-type protein [Xylariaceae sp. FL0804]
MASTENRNVASHITSQHHRSKSSDQRSKSSVFKSFMHRLDTSNAAGLPSNELVSETDSNFPRVPQHDMGFPNFSRPAALGEIQQNQVGGTPRSPSKQYERPPPPAPSSPSKKSSVAVAVKATDKSAKTTSKPRDQECEKPKKTKSTTNLAALLSRPKSSKNLHKLADEDEARSKKDKENRTPPCSTPQETTRPPIYAQFSSGALEGQAGQDYKSKEFGSGRANNTPLANMPVGTGGKRRPWSYQAPYSAPDVGAKPDVKGGSGRFGHTSARRLGLGIFTNGSGSKDKPATTPAMSEFELDPRDINKHLEAMLDRRNIPENQRYKMRNLSDTIKMEFIRQDWAESRGINNARPDSLDGDEGIAGVHENGDSKSKKTRGRSFTLSRNSAKKSDSRSPSKKREGTLGRHFRSRSTESVASERPTSAGSSSGSGILAKMKLQQGPVDYVAYLRKVQKPESVEVGKLHKLRLLLRNETVAWTEEFIRQGGMQEIVGLLQRIMEVEWREEHEDALLHENLLCLKALCTTALALQYLHSIQATLFPALLHMLFDPEKKGPSEFTTRNIITSVLFTYIQSASPQDRPVRARTVLAHLRDPEPKEEERPPGFVMEMRRERPYRVWCKEATSVTKEVFWIFLHHLNVVYLPRDKEQQPREGGAGPPSSLVAADDAAAYMQTHFPQERPPVPAAPYVGGVEWDATNYLASHLDLLNAIVACTPTAGERNALRGLMRISGWERLMGGSLRLCKEKFYPCVHDALRTWVAAAAEDGWDVRDVRYGPPAEARSPAKSKTAAAAAKQAAAANNNKQPPPKIEMPKLNFGPSPCASPSAKVVDEWLS